MEVYASNASYASPQIFCIKKSKQPASEHIPPLIFLPTSFKAISKIHPFGVTRDLCEMIGLWPQLILSLISRVGELVNVLTNGWSTSFYRVQYELLMTRFKLLNQKYITVSQISIRRANYLQDEKQNHASMSILPPRELISTFTKSLHLARLISLRTIMLVV